MSYNGSGWTVDTVLEHVQALIEDRDIALKTALAANEKRLDSMNEMRQQLHDQASKLLSRDEYAARHDQLSDDISRLRERLDVMQGAQNALRRYTSVVLALLGVMVAVGTMLVFLLKP